MCIPAFAALALFKWYLIRYDAVYAAQPIVDWDKWEPWQFFALYVFVTFSRNSAAVGFSRPALSGC